MEILYFNIVTRVCTWNCSNRQFHYIYFAVAENLYVINGNDLPTTITTVPLLCSPTNSSLYFFFLRKSTWIEVNGVNNTAAAADTVPVPIQYRVFQIMIIHSSQPIGTDKHNTHKPPYAATAVHRQLLSWITADRHELH